jgi:hypothetical protein
VLVKAITHRSSGVTVETPLIIPSFSSKGFAGSGAKSEVRQILETASELLTEAYLISAFDIAKGHIPPPAELPMKPDLIVVDSGGYEISNDYDLSEVSRVPVRKQKWQAEDLKGVLDVWPSEIPAIFVSYDHPTRRMSVPQQIAEARSFFRNYPDQLSCLLLKPETADQSSLKEALGAAMVSAQEFVSFDVVGVTEKGLAASPLDRMVAIARLRRALTEAGCGAPIHVFGSLDPLSICLYVLAGAEIFDGLTWLRYAFVDDQCVYPHSHATFRFGIDTKDTTQRLRMISDNYYYLMKIQANLREFAVTNDFRLLPHSRWMKDAYSRLQTKLTKHGR